MSAKIIPFPSRSAHLWIHPHQGGWVTVTSKPIDPEWPAQDAEWLPTTVAARIHARRLAERHGVRLFVHGGEF